MAAEVVLVARDARDDRLIAQASRAVIGLRGLAPAVLVEATFLPGLIVGVLDGGAVISTSSISNMRVEFGPIGARLPISPYARSEGINSLHFDPTGMI